MRVVIHDYSGHPFQVQLSRELSTRGHTVSHWYCSSYATGRGAVEPRSDDPADLSLLGISMASKFERYSPWRRLQQELRYGHDLGRRLARARPDVVIFCNTPLIAHAVAAFHCARSGIPMIFWQQDIYSLAISITAKERLGIAGGVVARLADRVERGIAHSSAAVVPISDDYLPILESWGVRERATVIPNWAPVPELPLRPRDNEWARAHDLVGRPVLLYSGTLGLKHDPSIFVDLAQAMRTEMPKGRVVVVSEGRGRDWLAQRKSEARLENLLLLGYQSYQRFPDMMASADVLIAVLEPSAGRYSVPSKILSYLCSGRPVVAVLPAENAAASTLLRSGGGIVVDPSSRRDAINEVLALLLDTRRMRDLGRAGREYSEKTFNIVEVAERFEGLMFIAVAARASRSRSATK